MTTIQPYILAQAAPPAPSWISVDNIFWFTILAIFLITIFTALLRRLAKDKALKLFHEYHVTFFSERRASLWGDCLVFSQGVELLFDQAFTTRRNLVKSSALLYEDEFGPMICMTRSIHGLTKAELDDRAAQIQRTFRPGPLRRAKRWFRNMLNTMRDAITKTMNLVIGRMTAVPGSMAGAAISTQAGDISTLTGNVVNLAANAYEPLLERYIGQPVIVEIALPPAPGTPPPPGWIPPTAEFPGYLVDYTAKFIAVFNVDHTPVEEIEIKLEKGKTSVPEIPELKIDAGPNETIIRCEGKDAFVLRNICCAGEASDLGIAMIPGTMVSLASIEDGVTMLKVERTRQIDLLVPRTRARIRYGALPVRKEAKKGRTWLGIAPVSEPREFLRSLRQDVHHVRRSLFTDAHAKQRQTSDGEGRKSGA